MNLKSEQNFSMDELMEMNRPPHMRQAEAEQTTPPTPAMPSIEIHCPLPEEMDEVNEYLRNLENRYSRQEIQMKALAEKCNRLATQAQMDELLKVAKHLEQMTEQAGKPKEKSSLRHRIRLPRLRLSLPEWDWPTMVTVVMALAMAMLLLVWFKSGGDWSSLNLLNR